MPKQAGPYTSDTPAMIALARAIERFAQTDGDHTTAIPALTLHRRQAPTEPLHCIYNLGLGVGAGADVVVARHRHGAESYAGDVKSADRDVLHGDFNVAESPPQSFARSIEFIA